MAPAPIRRLTGVETSRGETGERGDDYDRARIARRLVANSAQRPFNSRTLEHHDRENRRRVHRRAVNAVDGDDVEVVSFPKNQTHVFSYCFAVPHPPESGTIIGRKQLAHGSVGQRSFRFDGSLSFADTNRDGVNDFTRSPTATSPASQTFIRGAVSAGEPLWEVAEAPADGRHPTSQGGTGSSPPASDGNLRFERGAELVPVA
ncbi:hypothetical protein [Microbacterium sp. NPDC077486]|uniref:hypothetical protein n=1 Tax=Microbacterium sp. NPDC077486 TaxID=3154766 RepID=UPI00342B5A1B